MIFKLLLIVAMILVAWWFLRRNAPLGTVENRIMTWFNAMLGPNWPWILIGYAVLLLMMTTMLQNCAVTVPEAVKWPFLLTTLSILFWATYRSYDPTTTSTWLAIILMSVNVFATLFAGKK